MGESAGGGSIMHHVTACGDGEKVPFQQVILESPAFQPTLLSQEKAMFEIANTSTISNTNINSVRDLKELAVCYAARDQRSHRRQLPVGRLLLRSRRRLNIRPPPTRRRSIRRHLEPSVKVMVGHNSEEGSLFTSPFIQTQKEYVALSNKYFPPPRQP